MASPHPLHISVENADELLNAGALGAGALIEIQWCATELGTYAAISGTGSTPTIPLVSGTTSYTGYNPNGDWATWYRVRYRSADSARVSVDWAGDTLWYTRAGHAPFQVGPEAGGALCSRYDIKQRLGIGVTDLTKDELIDEFIGRVAMGIMGYTGRRFARRPSSGTTTFLFDIRQATRTLWVPRGIAEMSQLEVATQTGGIFTVVPTADWFLDPPETERDHGWPATCVTLSDRPTGGVSYFYPGKRVVRTTMAEGWAAVPGDIAGIAEDEVIRRYQGRGQGHTGAESTEAFIRLLRANSPDDAARLTWYSNVSVA